LSLKALQDDPWDKIDELIQLETGFQGVVESSTNFGVFVTITDGVTGLLPRSRIRKTDNFKSGDAITLMVTAIDKESKRITLDYTDRGPDEVIETRPRYEDQGPREPRSGSDNYRGGGASSGGGQDNYRGASSNRKGGRSRSDEEWRKYANQKVNPSEDNPFKDL
ncbi:MAG: S1 RNA-binding domain-containing protein, partial [Candidatus Cloacimonetes bacterium]|nr:S1 RNA-binding domain-containing protein [Candidatus Cloacimonadota bacterium]